jgi:putative ABC transport system permease protein
VNAQWVVFAWRNTLRNRRRSLVAVALAALGTAAILVAGGFALFTYRGLAEDAARTTGHLVIAQAAQFSDDEDVPLQNGLSDSKGLIQKLLDLPEVRHVLPRVDFSGLISNGAKSTVMLAYGVDPDAEFTIKGPFMNVVAGNVLTKGDIDSVVLGKALAHSLNAQVGAGLTLMATTTEGSLNAIDVKVKGIVDTGIPDIDLRLVYTDIGLAQRLLLTDKVSRIGLFLDRLDSTPSALREVRTMVTDLEVRSWDDLAPYYQSVRALYDRIFGALGIIIAVIVVFVVVNSMAMSIIERTREIGALRAMGTAPMLLTRLFAMEGLMLGAMGAVVGVLISLLVSLLLLEFPVQMPPPPGRSVGYPLQISYSTELYAITVLGMLTLAGVASALVARRTVRIPIVDALGHN